MSKPVSILIPTRRAFEAIELTIESTLAKTWYDNFRIIVCDNSRGEGEGNRNKYLKQLAKSGAIKLIENTKDGEVWKQQPDGTWSNKYGHGENLKMLLSACQTDYAVLLSSGIELVTTTWVDELMALLKTKSDIGAARYRPARNNFETSWVAPVWWPNLMLLNMNLYRKITDDSDWDLARVPYEDFPYKQLFDGQRAPKNPDPEGMMVFLDTGYNLWRKLTYDNPEGFRMINFDTNPTTYQWRDRYNFFIGLDRNSHRPEHSFVKSQRFTIQERLRKLRCQN